MKNVKTVSPTRKCPVSNIWYFALSRTRPSLAVVVSVSRDSTDRSVIYRCAGRIACGVCVLARIDAVARRDGRGNTAATRYVSRNA